MRAAEKMFTPLGGSANKIAIGGGEVYVVGDFSSAGGKLTFNFARWLAPAPQT